MEKLFIMTIALIPCVLFGERVVFPVTSTPLLRFETPIPQETRCAMQEDFEKCLSASGSRLQIYEYQDWVQGLFGLWQPYGGCAYLNDLGPYFPRYGTLSNGVFTVSIPYSFATNYQGMIESVRGWSNEVASAFAFPGTHSRERMLSMQPADVVKLYLTKEAPSEECGLPNESYIEKSARLIAAKRLLPPPLFAFHIWDGGPTNSPPYLWCEVPCIEGDGLLTWHSLIYYNGQWWLTEWPLEEGDQQW